MRTSFTSDKIRYVVEYDDKRQEFSFWVDVGRSDRAIYTPTAMERGFWDPLPERILGRTHAARYVLHVAAQVRRFIESVVARRRPHYFTYAASEADRMPLYCRFGERLARRYGYLMTVDGPAFRFTRQGAL